MASQATITARTFNDRWNEMYQRLVRFKEVNGHCLVPNRYPKDKKLGAWVSAQRRHYKILTSGTNDSTPMTMERAQKLVDLGFDWSTTDPRHVSWEDRYQELKDFRTKYGHTIVPMNWSGNPSLSNWVSAQRQDYKLFQKGRPSRLTQEKIDQLNDIGFVWEAQRGGRRRKLESLSEMHQSTPESSTQQEATVALPSTSSPRRVALSDGASTSVGLPPYYQSYPSHAGSTPPDRAVLLAASLDRTPCTNYVLQSYGAPSRDFGKTRREMLLTSLQNRRVLPQEEVAPTIGLEAVANASRTLATSRLPETEETLLRNRMSITPSNIVLLRLRGQLMEEEHRRATVIASLVAREQIHRHTRSDTGPLTATNSSAMNAASTRPNMLTYLLAAPPCQVAGRATLSAAAHPTPSPRMAFLERSMTTRPSSLVSLPAPATTFASSTVERIKARPNNDATANNNINVALSDLFAANFKPESPPQDRWKRARREY